MERELCGKWMPVARETCVRGAGHLHNCRTKATLERKRIADRAYKQGRQEERAAYNRAYYREHREELCADARAYHQEHRKERIVQMRKWKDDHPAEVFDGHQRHAARRRARRIADRLGVDISGITERIAVGQ